MVLLLWVVATNPVLPSFTVDLDQIDGLLRVAGEVLAVVAGVALWRGRADKKTRDALLKAQQVALAEQEAQEKRIIEAVVDATKPVQPGYRNGGESLADIANEVRRHTGILSQQNSMLSSLHGQVNGVREELNMHRLAVQDQFATFRTERAELLAAADQTATAWAVALSAHGIEVPHVIPPPPDESI
jgi:hypothetical protein